MDNWHWYQWTLSILMFFRVMVHASNNGKPLKGDYSFPMALVNAFLVGFLLWKGGFWQ